MGCRLCPGWGNGRGPGKGPGPGTDPLPNQGLGALQGRASVTPGRCRTGGTARLNTGVGASNRLGRSTSRGGTQPSWSLPAPNPHLPAFCPDSGEFLRGLQSLGRRTQDRTKGLLGVFSARGKGLESRSQCSERRHSPAQTGPPWPGCRSRERLPGAAAVLQEPQEPQEPRGRCARGAAALPWSAARHSEALEELPSTAIPVPAVESGGRIPGSQQLRGLCRAGARTFPGARPGWVG